MGGGGRGRKEGEEGGGGERGKGREMGRAGDRPAPGV